MNKDLTPLQALEELSELAITPDLKVLPKFDGWTRLEVMNRYKPIIEKALKALEIIKKYLEPEKMEFNDTKIFYLRLNNAGEIPQEEYELLKEALK